MLKVANRKKILSILLIFIMVGSMFNVAPVNAQVDYGGYNGISVDTEPILPDKEVHPKLWFDESQKDEMYEKRNADEYAAELWSSISTNAYLTREIPTEPPMCQAEYSSGEIHSYYGDMARIAKYNAFMYAMEGDEKHLQKATDALKQAYAGPIYDCEYIDPVVSGSPVDETYRAMWAQNFAAAYDWVQNDLTPDDDQQIRELLAFEAQTLYENIWIRPDSGWGPRPHNHRSKPAWGLGSLALVLSNYSDSEKASPAEWLEEALEAANSNLAYFFSSDGVYREGSQYYIYSHINFLPFLYHYKNVSGVDHFRDFKPAFIWEFNVSNNNGWMPNFADSYLRHNYMHMVAPQFMTDEDVTPLHQTAKWGNLFQWRYATTDTNPWGGENGNNTGASNDDTMDLDKYLTYEPSIDAIAPTGSGTSFFIDGGQTIFRNNWNVDDPNSRYLMFHGVAEADNHNQFDHLSFLIHAENQMMASDSGYSRSAYGDEIRRSWYRTAEAHNTVTLDGYWPVDMEQNQTPESKYSIDTDFFDFQQKSARFIEIENDASRGENELLFPPDNESLGHVTRAIAFPGQEYFVVADQLSSTDGTDKDFSVYLHGGKGMMSGEKNFRQWTYGNDMYGSAAKFGAWFLTNEAEFTDHVGEVSYLKDDYTEHGYVEAAVNDSKVNMLQILVPMNITKDLPIVTNLSDSVRAGGTVQMDGNLDTYLVQQTSTPVTVGDIDTDASFAYVRQSGLMQHFSVREAKKLTYQGEKWFEASEAITVAMDVSKRDQYTGTLSTGAASYTVSIKVPFGKQVEAVSLDGVEMSYVENAGIVTLSNLQGDGDIVIDFVNSDTLDQVAPSAIIDLVANNETGRTVELEWTAPGNDGNIGTAAFYDIRYSTEPILAENWDDATKVSGEPKPSEVGSKEFMAIEGLNPETTYYFGMKTGDETLNMSDLSNIVEIKTLFEEDTIPPAAIFDLTVANVTTHSALLEWTATGNDGFFGNANHYDIRYSTEPITEENWDNALSVQEVPRPSPAGSGESMEVSDLQSGRTYFFAMKASDESGNISNLSNQIFVALQDGEDAQKLDIIHVTASEHDGNIPENTIDGDLATRWSAESQGALGERTAQNLEFDLGAIQNLAYMKIAYHSGNIRESYFDLQVSVDGSNWTDVLINENSSGLTLDFETYELANTHARYVRLLGYGNSASGWNSITEVEIYGTDATLPDIMVDHAKLTDEEGNEVTELISSESVVVKIPTTNNTAVEQKVTAIVALYNEENRVVNAITIGNNISPWETEIFTAGMKLPNEVNGHYVKVLLWDDITSMKPKAGTLQFP